MYEPSERPIRFTSIIRSPFAISPNARLVNRFKREPKKHKARRKFINTHLRGKSEDKMKNPDISIVNDSLKSYKYSQNRLLQCHKFKTLAQYKRAIRHFVLGQYKK